MTILIQATTTRWLAGQLGLLDEHKIVAEKPSINVSPTVARSR
jgi:hypothetical protein